MSLVDGTGTRPGESGRAGLYDLGGLDSGCDSTSNVAFSNDGQLVASGSFDGVIKVWDISSRNLKCEDFTPDGGKNLKKSKEVRFHISGSIFISSNLIGNRESRLGASSVLREFSLHLKSCSSLLRLVAAPASCSSLLRLPARRSPVLRDSCCQNQTDEPSGQSSCSSLGFQEIQVVNDENFGQMKRREHWRFGTAYLTRSPTELKFRKGTTNEKMLRVVDTGRAEMAALIPS
ncbi:hypothetical protein LXL04_035748 [Taraxacum kok-saghyz]